MDLIAVPRRMPHCPKWTRLICLLMLLCSVVGAAIAGIFDPPFASSALDTSAYKCIAPGGSETAMSGAPTDVLWTSNTSPGSTMMTFGDSKTAGARHLRIGFTSAQTVGTIVVKGNVSVSVLKSGVTYPGTLTNESDWTPAERLEGASVVQSQSGTATQAQSGAVEVHTWVLPSGTSTRAIRLTHTAQRSDYAYEGVVNALYVLTGRYGNMASQASITASATTDNLANMINRIDEGHTGVIPSYNGTVYPWTNGTNANPITALNDEWVMLVWPSTISLRGINALGAGFGAAEVEYLPTSVTAHPSETLDSDWVTQATNNSVQAYNTNQLGLNWFDFGSSITTRAIRLRITAPSTTLDSSGGKKVWLAELQAFTDLGANALSAAIATPSYTNAPIPVTFTLANAGYVTLVIDDNTGKRMRNLVMETYFPAGAHTVYWDGLDESEPVDISQYGLWNYKTNGKLVPTGTYTVKGLVRDALTLTYEMSVNTAGNPAWFNRDNTGGWLADHSLPMGVGFIPGATPRVMILSPVCELGSGVVLTDLTGKVTYSTRSVGAGGYWWGGDHVATDVGSNPESGVLTYFLASGGDGVDANNPTGGNRTATLWAYFTNNTGAQRYSYTYPTDLNFVANRPAFGGAAVRNQVAAISLNQSNQVQMVNVTNGTLLSTSSVTNPRGLAFDGSGNLIVLSGTSVVRYSVNWGGDKSLSGATTLVTGLQDPHGLTLDSNGDMYVSDWGTSNQVKVYTSSGTFVRAIGTAGAVAGLGTYDPTHMNHPWGVTISDDAGTKRLWVAEYYWSPRRISRWTLTGTLDTAFYGPGPFENGAALDPTDYTKCYVGHWYGDKTMEYTLDWTTGTATLTKLISDNPLGFTGPWNTAASMGGAMALTVNGQKYLLNQVIPGRENFGMPMVGVWHLRNGIGVSVAAAGNAQNWPLLKSTNAFKDRWVALGLGTYDGGTGEYTLTTDPVFFAWTDTDNDQQVQPSEVTMKRETKGVNATYIGTDLTVYTFNGTKLAPSGYTANYAPIYNTSNAVEEFTPTFPVGLANGGIDVVGGSNGWRVLDANPLQGWQNGTLKWMYPNERPGPQENMYPPLPRSAGQIVCGAKMMGFPFDPAGGSDLGELFAINGARGQVYIFTMDGLFVGTLLKDTRDMPYWNALKSLSFRSLTAQRGMDVTDTSFGDNWFSSLMKSSDGNVYLLGGGEHSSILRVNGLTSGRRLTPFNVIIDSTTHTATANWQLTHERERQQQGLGRKTLTLGWNNATIAIDGSTNEWPKNAQLVQLHSWMPERLDWIGGEIKGAICVDTEKLYVAMFTDDPNGMANSGSDWQRLFRTGGAVEIALGTSSANPNRTAAQDGDLRLLVTKANDVVKATLYRQVKSGGTSVTYTNAAGRQVTMQDVQDVSSQVAFAQSGNTFELSVPLSTLGFSPQPGVMYLGDLAVLRGRDNASAQKYTYQRVSWNSKAPGAIGDEPYEVQCYPQVWGRMQFAGTQFVKVTAPTHQSTFTAGSNLTVSADVSAGLAVSRVEFYAGGEKIGEDTSSPYSVTWSNVPWGHYFVSAKAVTPIGATIDSYNSVEITATGGDISAQGLSLWLKADAIVGVGSGQGIQSWTDSSGLGRHATQVETAKRPQYVGNSGVGLGMPLVRFDGTNDWVDFGKIVDIRTVFWMIKDNAVGSGGAFLLGDTNTVDFHRGVYYDFAGPNSALFSDSWANPNVYAFWTNNTTRSWINGTSVDCRYYGVPNTLSRVTTRTNGNVSASNFSNDRVGGTNVWNGDLAELIIYNRALTDTEIATVEAYLNTKYFGPGNQRPTATLTAPTDGATYAVPASVTITATAADSDGSISKVEFYNGTTKLGEDTSSPYSYTWTNASDGSYNLTARAVDNSGGGTVSNGAAITVTLGDTPVQQINCGGSAVSGTNWVADTGYSGGTGYTASDTVDTSGVTNPAPQDVYKAERYGNMTYTLGSMTAGNEYTVRLHFAETWFNSANQRKFNVKINNTQVLTNFDIYTAAGGHDKATVQTFTATANGSGQIVIEFINSVDNAKINGIEILPIAAGTGLTGTYYNTNDLSGTSVLTRTDAAVNNDWASSSPDASVNVDNFSARWTGYVKPQYSETYTFYTAADDGARLWVNGQQIVNDWPGGHGEGEYYGTIALTAGQKYDIIMEYRELTGGAVARLKWSSASQAKEVISQAKLYPGNGTVATPTFSPGTGYYSSAQSVTMSCTTSGATIRYTTDGSEPTSSSTVYSSAINVSATTTLKAKAFMTNWNDSATATGTYTFCNGTGLTGAYYNTNDLTGSVVLTRTDATVDFTWAGSPATGVNSDNFSARWTGQVQPLYSETYTFYTAADDGARLWVNGQQLVNDWPGGHPEYEYSGTIALTAGQKYDIVMEFRELTGGAAARLRWSSASQAKQIIPQSQLYVDSSIVATPTFSPAGGSYGTAQSVTISCATSGATIRYTADGTDPTSSSTVYSSAVNVSSSMTLKAKAFKSGLTDSLVASATYAIGAVGLTGTYYNSNDLSGTAVLTRTDATVNFDWSGAPDASVNADNFSARWVGQVQPLYSETYTFYTAADDGARLWVNGQQLVNDWPGGHGEGEYYGTIALTAGQKYDIIMEYRELTGGAVARLKWSSVSQAKAVIPQSALYPGGTGTVGTPFFSNPPAGRYSSAQTVAISCPTYGSTIRYTTDGSDPTSSSTLYSSPITVSSTTTVKAKAFKTGMTDSAVGSGTYTISAGTGLTAYYFNNIDLTSQQLTRTDANVNFDWGSGTPDASIGAETFSVRWTGDVMPRYSETYTFYVDADDGFKLWVNGTVVKDAWNGRPAGEQNGTITLTAGQLYDITLEFCEDTGNAKCKLSWASTSQSKEVIPQSQLVP